MIIKKIKMLSQLLKEKEYAWPSTDDVSMRLRCNTFGIYYCLILRMPIFSNSFSFSLGNCCWSQALNVNFSLSQQHQLLLFQHQYNVTDNIPKKRKKMMPRACKAQYVFVDSHLSISLLFHFTWLYQL